MRSPERCDKVPIFNHNSDEVTELMQQFQIQEHPGLPSNVNCFQTQQELYYQQFSNYHFQRIMREYLREFWRHQCELQDGERGYTSKISSPEHLSLFWDGLEDSQKMAFSKQFNVNLSSVDTSNNPYYVRKTRWQYYAEKYFTTLLGLQGEEFDPFVGRHLRALVDYKLRVEQNDPELRDIINNYISTL